MTSTFNSRFNRKLSYDNFSFRFNMVKLEKRNSLKNDNMLRNYNIFFRSFTKLTIM